MDYNKGFCSNSFYQRARQTLKALENVIRMNLGE